MKTCRTSWNRRCVRYLVGGLLAAGFLRPCGICRGGTVYDAAADLTKESVAAHVNPNGPWSYGYRASAVSSDFTPFTSAGVSAPWRAVTENVQGWWLGSDDGGNPSPAAPFVLKNMGTAPVASTYHPYSHQTLQPGAMYVHPAGGDNAYVVVCWTAPAPGTYLLETVFTGLDSRGTTTDVHVGINGRAVFAADIRGGLQAATNVQAYSTTVSVSAGDKIDFAVGPGGNGPVCDSTGFTAKINLLAPASGQTVFDAAADLTKESVAAQANPNGPWSYGYRGSAVSSEFTLLPSSGVEEVWRAVAGNVQGWWLEPARGFDHSPPWLLKNMGTATVSSTFHPFSTISLPPGAMCVHPADGAKAYVVARWTAPATGSCLIDTVFAGLDSRGTTTDVHVVISGQELFAGDIRGGLNTPTNVASYKKTVSVAKGDTIDFAVGPGGNGYICDSTGLSARITMLGSTAGEAGDLAAIRKTGASFVDACNRGDAKAAAELWSDTGGWTGFSGRRLQGKQAIERELDGLLKEYRGVRIELIDPAIRLISPEVAVEEGTVRIVHPPEAPEDDYSRLDSDRPRAVPLVRSAQAPEDLTCLAIYVKKDGQWKLDSVRKTSLPRAASSPLEPLAWLVGDWVDPRAGSTVAASVKWTKNKRFLSCSFRLPVPGTDDLQGTQTIGWDPATGTIRSWMFGCDGDLGEGAWSKKDNAWIVTVKQVLADGHKASATHIYTIVDSNTYTWQSIGRQMDDKCLPDIAPVKLVRRGAAEAGKPAEQPLYERRQKSWPRPKPLISPQREPYPVEDRKS